MQQPPIYSPIPQGPSPFGTAHPVLVAGVFMFIIPFFNSVLGWNIPGWISGIGIFLILVGAFLSIMNQ